MMASPSELSLDCKPHSYSLLLKSVGEQQNDQTQKLEEFLSRLEEERLKIDAFKRELPLCMQLLTNAMEAYRQQLQSYRANQGPKPILEEFIPLKHASNCEGSDKAATLSTDKSNWMTSAQLWSQASDQVITKQQQQHSPVTSPKHHNNNNYENGFMSIVNHPPKQQHALDNNNKQRNGGGGAFHPFSKDRSGVSCPSQTLRGGLPDLALASSPDKDMDQDQIKNPDSSCRVGNGMGQVKGGSDHHHHQPDSQTNNNPGSATSQTHRKARRCWSPDLHRRFVNALQMLGGSQVATPKQIRELMKVDGLTNDEVKSHLQKYRLHTRRPSPSPQAAAAATPQLVVLGGIWVPPEYATAAHAGAPPAALYGTHPTAAHASAAAAHYCAAATPAGAQEFYPAPPPTQAHPHQLHHHAALHHNQLHIYNPSVVQQQAQSSPESDVRGTGDRSESIEDGKSESSSWKADSNGENGGERKMTLVVREEGEESNASEITLKF